MEEKLAPPTTHICRARARRAESSTLLGSAGAPPGVSLPPLEKEGNRLKTTPAQEAGRLALAASDDRTIPVRTGNAPLFHQAAHCFGETAFFGREVQLVHPGIIIGL